MNMFEFQRTQIIKNCEYSGLSKHFPKLLMCKAEALHTRVAHTEGHEWKDRSCQSLLANPSGPYRAQARAGAHSQAAYLGTA